MTAGPAAATNATSEDRPPYNTEIVRPIMDSSLPTTVIAVLTRATTAATAANATRNGSQDSIQHASGHGSSGVVACLGGVAELLVFSGRSSGVSCFNSILLYV